MVSNKFIFFIVFATALYSNALGKSDSGAFANQIGFFAINGEGGPTYRIWINDTYGIQCSGFFFSQKTILKGEVTGRDISWTNCFELAGIRKIKKWKYVTGTSFIGITYFSNGIIDDERVVIDSATYNYHFLKNVTDQLTLGNSVGLDFRLWHFSLSFMVGVRFGYSFAESDAITPSPSLGLGIFYGF